MLILLLSSKRLKYVFLIILVEGDNADNDPNHWRVVVGDHDRLASGESNETNHEIQKIITHEDYDYFDYDIGEVLLILIMHKLKFTF